MDYIEGSNRDQLILFPQSLDEYIREDNPVRFIDALEVHPKSWTLSGHRNCDATTMA
jgi:hypothetical protein